MNKSLFSIVERLASKGWRGVLESTRRMMGLYSKVLLCVFGRLSKGHCLAIYSMSRSIRRLYKRSNPLFVGLYLKQVSFLLMKYISGDKEKVVQKVYVKTNRTGLPIFIPPYYRKLIRGGRGSLAIQVVLTVCTLSKLILVSRRKGRGAVDASSIVQMNFKLVEESKTFIKIIRSEIFDLFEKYIPFSSKIPLKLGFRVGCILSSGPNTYKDYTEESCIPPIEGFGRRSLSVYHTFSLDCYAAFSRFIQPYLELIGSVFYLNREVFIGSSLKDETAKADPLSGQLFVFFTYLNSLHASDVWTKCKLRAENGRFGLKLEGSGKVRVFAIANPLFQGLLRSLHDWAMDILKLIPMDGTFNQLAPLLKLKGKRDLYSFDLKSATDLFPADFSVQFLESLFGNDLADSWRFMMQYVSFRDQYRSKRTKEVRCLNFTRGQPLGYYSSWPVFALTHHVLVWVCARVVYPKLDRFVDYALLGDDIVIADKTVALKYKEVLDACQIVLSREKSLISNNGTCEFAKRFIIKNDKIKERLDLSPLSLKLLRLCRGYTSPFVFAKLGCSFRNSFRLRGGGYRVYSRIGDPFKDVHTFRRLSMRWKRHWLSMFSSSGLLPLPINLWLGFPEKGYLDCEEVGMVYHYVLSRVRPKDLNEKSFSSLYPFFDKDFGEAVRDSLMVPFVKLHLNYILWYCNALNLSYSLDKLFDPPICPIKVERALDSSMFLRYGLLFKSWDFIRNHPKPKVLGYFKVSSPQRDLIYATESVAVVYAKPNEDWIDLSSIEDIDYLNLDEALSKLKAIET